jgi:hypothetical protein
VTGDLIVRRREGLIHTEVDGELVALHIGNGACYGFNATATRIWAMIETPKRLSELQRELLDEYEVDPETCRSELIEMLEGLRQDGLIDLDPAPVEG